MLPEAVMALGAAILFTYAGYPALAYLLARIARRPVLRGTVRRRVSVVLPVHNEGRRLGAKIENLLLQDYPRELLEIIVVDDGSADGAVDALPGDLRAQAKFVTFGQRLGKATALNAGVVAASGDVIVFTDARQRLATGALSALVSNFADARVTAVTGALVTGEKGAGGAFRRYEEALRSWESSWGSVAGATGALYAVRRSSVAALPAETILDDLVMSLSAAGGGRLVYEPRAVASEPGEDSARTHPRRLRTLAGNWQILFHPLRYRRIFSPRTLVQLVCHKFLRLAFPFFVVAFAISAAFAGAGALFAVTAAAAVLVVACLPRARRDMAAELAGSILVAPSRALWRYLSGRESVLWARR